jgi:hypothetical protein
MIAPPTAPRPGELWASASARGIVVASVRTNNNGKLRCIKCSSKRSNPMAALNSSQDEKEIRQNSSPSLSTPREAQPSLARLLNDGDVLSVNAVPWQVAHGGC